MDGHIERCDLMSSKINEGIKRTGVWTEVSVVVVNQLNYCNKDRMNIGIAIY